MKNIDSKKRYLIFVVLLIVIFAAAYMWYDNFEENYDPSGRVSDAIDIELRDFVVEDVDGNSIRISEIVGDKPIVINFWATTCNPCKVEMPHFEEAYKEYGDQVEFMMVNLTYSFRESVSGVKDFIARKGYSFPLYFDMEGEVADLYDIHSVPRTLFIDRNGRISRMHYGTLDKAVLDIYISTLLD